MPEAPALTSTDGAPIVGVTTPVAPGRVGSPASPTAVARYVRDLVAWRAALHDHIESLDRHAQMAADPDVFTADVTLAWTMWQAISNRTDEIVGVWDSGRVDDHVLDVMTSLIWSRMDGSLGGALSVSLGEAATLVEALLAGLGARLEADALARVGVGDRLAPLREQLDRLEQFAADGVIAAAAVRDLSDRFLAIVERARQGSDERTAIATLERDAAARERDAMILAAARTAVTNGTVRVAEVITALRVEEVDLRSLAERALSRISGLRPLAVPDADSLAVPDASIDTEPGDAALWQERREALAVIEGRAEQVHRAFTQLRAHYQGALDEREELRGLLESYRVMASRRGRAEDEATTVAYRAAHEVLYRAPCDLTVARGLVDQYAHCARTAAPTGRGPVADHRKDV